MEEHDWGTIAAGLRVTLSMGLACIEDAVDPAALWAAADERLYRAKKTGRNRVVGVDEPGAPVQASA